MGPAVLDVTLQTVAFSKAFAACWARGEPLGVEGELASRAPSLVPDQMRLGAEGLAAFVTTQHQRGFRGFRPTTSFAGHVPLQGRLVLEGFLAGKADMNHSRTWHGCKTERQVPYAIC